MVDRAGFEPAALRSTASAFPQSGSNMLDLPSGRSSASLRHAVYQADLPAHRARGTEASLLNWFCLEPSTKLAQAASLRKNQQDPKDSTPNP